MYERLINLIGENNFQKIQSKKILLVGVGGVGSFAFTSLIRSGFLDITIIDYDKVEMSNLNRQLVASLETVSKDKVEVATNMASIINKDIKITSLNIFLNENNMDMLARDYDYIIDACDSLKTKYFLIKYAQDNHIKIISSMGVGNRLDASKVKVTKLNKTSNDPLAKKLRKLLKDNNLNLNIPVVWSEEVPIKKGKVDSIITSPGIAGILMVNYIINDIIHN